MFKSHANAWVSIRYCMQQKNLYIILRTGSRKTRLLQLACFVFFLFHQSSLYRNLEPNVKKPLIIEEWWIIKIYYKRNNAITEMLLTHLFEAIQTGLEMLCPVWARCSDSHFCRWMTSESDVKQSNQILVWNVPVRTGLVADRQMHACSEQR